jgi:leucyl/phenylalanyl-tRNA--protein transferase
MKAAYLELYRYGMAWSFETWRDNKLVGGMYGVKCNQYCAGESMFSLESNASKFALIKACDFLSEKGLKLLDCQIHSDHLESMGAKYISRTEFQDFLTIKSE